MYTPVPDGIEKSARSVQYTELMPPQSLAGLVHCFWELKTLATLKEDFLYHALPDACVNILFNQVDPSIAGVTALRTKAEVLNLGKSFNYAGIQFYPGVWQGSRDEIVDSYVGTPYFGRLPLVETGKKMIGGELKDKLPVLSDLVLWFVEVKLAVSNGVTEKILLHLDEIRTVADMAALTGLSTRQLQRTLKDLTALPPHDLLKVLRVQQSFKKHYLELYADQAHFIHSFRNITGYTPNKYNNKFGV
jgi:AraC-like DNA-binding protein